MTESREVWAVFRIIQGAGGVSTLLLKIVDSEATAKFCCQELDMKFKSFLTNDLVEIGPNGTGQAVGLRVANFLQGLGITGIGHRHEKYEVESNLIVPQKHVHLVT